MLPRAPLGTALALGLALLGTGCTTPDAPEPPVYSVFFESNADTLAPRALAIVDQAAAAAKAERPPAVEVTGYATRTPIGSNDYNQRLSERRAEAVRQALIARGVPAETIHASGYGSSHSQTSDVVDRRVQIRFGS